MTGPIDSGADVAPAEAATPTDPCSHATYPPPPLKDDDPVAEVPSFAVAVREESVTGAIDGGAPIGFDLDGVCSCFADTSTAHAAEPSCIAPEGGAPACDGDGGVDREIDTLLAAYSVPNKGGAAGPLRGPAPARLRRRSRDPQRHPPCGRRCRHRVRERSARAAHRRRRAGPPRPRSTPAEPSLPRQRRQACRSAGPRERDRKRKPPGRRSDRSSLEKPTWARARSDRIPSTWACRAVSLQHRRPDRSLSDRRCRAMQRGQRRPRCRSRARCSARPSPGR